MTDNADKLKGLIFNIQKFSLQDGPGIRTTVFMKGCPLVCPWCSNPEGMRNEPEVMVTERKCIGCKKCEEACGPGAITFVNDMRQIDWNLCTQCLECGKVCPSHAIEIAGEYRTVEDVFNVVNQDSSFYSNSGGGVTVSGGEALMQWEFVLELFKKCKRAGFHTALDTTGYCVWENMEKVLGYTDLVLFDIKSADPEAHERITGVSNNMILENLKKASEMTTVWLRIPLTPGFNNSAENMRATAELAAGINAEKISLLPYHEWGRTKYTRLGRQYMYDGSDTSLAADSETVTRCMKILKEYGLNVEVGE